MKQVLNHEKQLIVDKNEARKLGEALIFFADGKLWVVKDQKLKELWSFLYRNLYRPADGDIFNASRANCQDLHRPKCNEKGISWHTKRQKWQLAVNGKHLGYFDTVEEAIETKRLLGG